LKVEYVEETSVRKALAFEIESEVVEKEIEVKARDYAKKARVPGFRPGKIPPDVIKKRFRAQVMEDVAEAIVNRVVFEEIEGRGLRPLASPQVSQLKIDEHQPMTFKAVFETLPILEAPDYKGLRAKAKKAEISAETVDQELDRLREDAARFDPVEGRAAQNGDYAALDLAWRPSAGGRGGRDENALVEIGSSDNHADFNAGLAAMSVGETKDIVVSYAADHPAKNLAGQTLHYTATLKALKAKIVPPADDEFAKDLAFDSLLALRGDIREKLQKNEERRVDRELKAQLVESLVERASFEVPEALVERHMTARTEQAARSLAMQGIDPSKLEMDWREYREKQREDSVKAAKADILLDEIARRAGIDASDEELDSEIARLAERVRRSKEALRAQMEKEGDLASLRARIREEKTLDLIKADAILEFE
jgi:trigger factor